MWTWLFWRAALERAIKTGVQAMLGLFSGDAVGLLDAPWGAALNVAGMMMVYSLLFSIGSGFVPADPWTSPSTVRTAPLWTSVRHRRRAPLDEAGTEPAPGGAGGTRA